MEFSFGTVLFLIDDDLLKSTKMKRNKQNSGLGRIDYRRWTGLLFFSFLSIISSHAQHSEQPQTIKTIKNFQSFHANNLSIKHLQENNALKPETVPKNVLQFSPNQTYVVQEKVQTIRPIDRSAYRNLDTDLRNQYASSDIKLLPETFIQTGSSTNDQLVYRMVRIQTAPSISIRFKEI